MSEQKSHRFRPPLYHREAGRPTARGPAAHAAEIGSEQQGWDAYRKWIAHTTAKPTPVQRTPVDHSIYSWKGYQNWADKVRQNWEPDES